MSAPDILNALSRLDRISELVDRLIRTRDLADQQDVAELLRREVELTRDALQPQQA